MKIQFNSDDDLPLNKQLKFHAMAIIIRSAFKRKWKVLFTNFLNECLYELYKCCNTKELTLQKELILIKQMHQKNVCFVVIGISKILVINLNQMFVINVMIY